MLSDIASRCLFFPAALFKLCPSLYVYHGNLTCNVAVTERLHERAMLHEKRSGQACDSQGKQAPHFRFNVLYLMRDLTLKSVEMVCTLC